MEIPKTLKPTWDKVSNDGAISKADYEKLITASAPTGKDTELDESEAKFLSSLKSDLEKNGGEKGSIPVSGLSFVQDTPPQVIKDKPIGEVPATLKKAWDSAVKDGKIDTSDYKALIEVASPNWSDEELDDKEKDFLSNLKALLSNSNGSISIEKPLEPKVETKATPTAETKKTEEKKPADKPAQTTQNEAAPESDAEDIGPAPEVKGESDEDIQHLNKIKTLITSLGDDPDFAPLKGIVDQRINNNGATKQFSTDVGKIMGSIQPGKKETLTQAKTDLQAAYDKLPEGVKANPEVNNLFKYSMGAVESQLNGRPIKATQRAAQNTQTPAANTDNVPKTLKATWDTVKADGKINVDDYQKLIKAATPNNKDEEIDADEQKFLSNLKTKVEAGGGVFSFVDTPEEPIQPTNTEKAQPSKAPENPFGKVPDTLKAKWDEINKKGQLNTDDYQALLDAATPNKKDEEIDADEQKFLSNLKTQLEASDGAIDLKPKANTESGNTTPVARGNKPVLLNWTGYTNENKKALSDAFGGSVVKGSKGMPLLRPQAAKAIAQAFGVSSITELQRKVNAKADGQFGPETFFKAKVYAANMMNKEGADPAEINRMLDSLGQDQEVKAMRQSSPSTATVKTAEAKPQDDGVPETLKSTWNQIIADGKINADDYKALMDAASPNKKNEEFDEKEMKFLGELKKMLEEKGGELEVQKPETNKPESKPEASSNGVPTTLKETWNKIVADGKIDTKDYEALLSAATPNKKDEELDEAEVEFLGKVKSQIEAGNGEMKVEKSEEKPADPGDGVPATLRTAWDKAISDGKLTKADFDSLMKAAAPNKKNSEFDNEELEFLASIRGMFDKNGTDVLNVSKPEAAAKPQAKTEAASADGVPATLKATWNKVTADGKLTKNDFEALMKAAAPTKKNSEFDNDELEFIAAIRDMFDKNNTDVLEINKPAASTQTQKAQPTPKNDGIPETLRAAWNKATSDGKLTSSDYEELLKAAAPTKKNNEFDSAEIAFLKTIREKLNASNGTITLKK